ncbi:Uncharacterised protein [Bordetella pertussis]|nr:Uncharacterised protein [Bordetella pertussis]
MILSLMALVSTASTTASRTRASLNGFLPLTSENSSSSRAWSMPMKMARASGAVSGLTPGASSRRFQSCTGTGCTRSISPDIRAATRVASCEIGWKTTSSILVLMFLSQYPSKRLSTVFTSGWRSVTMKGPVPLVCRLA